ncbi:MAG: preprotein translocase subunit SecE [Candidatus Gracilibacteria bacterium]|jgi:preprotein translocase SecE subunit
MSKLSESRIAQYFIGSWHELGKATWPTKKRAMNICILVVSFVLVAAALIAGVDFALNRGYTYLLTLAQ